jgi:hypothetical protein
VVPTPRHPLQPRRGRDPDHPGQSAPDPVGDAGGGWLIFALPPAEIAVHPATDGGRAGFYLLCDDVAASVAALQADGIEVIRPISDQGWGLLTAITSPAGSSSASPAPAPDGGTIELS